MEPMRTFPPGRTSSRSKAGSPSPGRASGDRAALGHLEANTALGRLCSSAQVKYPCFFNFHFSYKEDICYSTCCNSQAMVGNLNFIFDIQINSNSLRALSLWPGQSLVSEGSSSLTSGALVSTWWVSSQSPNAPVLPDVFPLSQSLKVVKIWCIRTKTTLKSLANRTNSFTYLQYFFLSSVYTLC